MPIFETPGSVVLEIRLPAGHVTVKSGDEPKTDVELVARGRRGEEAIEQIEVSARDQPGGHVVSIEQRDRFRLRDDMEPEHLHQLGQRRRGQDHVPGRCRSRLRRRLRRPERLRALREGRCENSLG